MFVSGTQIGVEPLGIAQSINSSFDLMSSIRLFEAVETYMACMKAER